MSQDFLGTLRRARGDVIAAIEEVDLRRTSLATRLSLLDDLIREYSRPDGVGSIEVPPGPRPRGRPRIVGGPSQEEVCRAARDALLEAGRPMTRGELLGLLDERGTIVRGGDRNKVLGTILWRTKDAKGENLFVSTDRGYWPADVRVPDDPS